MSVKFKLDPELSDGLIQHFKAFLSFKLCHHQVHELVKTILEKELNDLTPDIIGKFIVWNRKLNFQTRGTSRAF